MPARTDFAITRLESLHLAFKNSASYWEGYRADEGDVLTERFEFKRGWQTVYARYVESPLLKVTLADGTTGWGEANCGIGPEVLCAIADNIIAQMVTGREFGNPAALWDFLYDSQRGRGYSSGYWLDALAALDIAVWDALGRREGLPVAAMISDSPRTEIPVYLSGVRRNTLEERVEHVNQWRESGLRGAKIFLTGDWKAGLAELDGLQRGAPELEQWMVDTLWMCDADGAAIAKERYGSRGVRFFECPLQPEDLAGHQRLAALPGAPIALGEHFRTRYQLEPWLAQPQPLDIYQPDIGRTGISDFIKQRDMAGKAGIPTTPHMGTGVSIFQAATLQCAAVSSPEFLQEFQGGLSEKLGDASDTAWRYSGGAFRLPDRPGIGADIDEDGIEPFIVRR
ncbi:MAG: mandelate racemase/muconate lactonizing enzyme family protein [Chloroflexi bacterium]|nr:mandelate racemase/muconate lactonizing enzyme family protein [Chloroflexota bacterium]MDA1296854.1 mandelate racemase/muconate lactonizing enzyme family protein [Chloroflexota bacterium]